MVQSEAMVEAISGAAGSILALLATYPLKTIYTLQALSVDKKGQGAQVLSVLDIVRKYRLKGLYVGIEPSVVESGISSAVYFYLYSRLRDLAVHARRSSAAQQQQQHPDAPQQTADKEALSTKNQSIGILASLLVAAVAGVGNQLVTLPLAVVITRMQAQQKLQTETNTPSTGVLSIISSIWHESGLAGFWKGLLPALILVVNPAIQYMLYEQALRVLRKWKQERQQQQQQRRHDPADTLNASETADKLDATSQSTAQPSKPQSLSALEIFVASAAAKIGATVLTYPMIVVKSRLQAGSQSKSSSQSLQYRGTLHVILRTFQDEGLGGFFKGLRAKILQTALNAALMLMLKEQCYTATQAALRRSSAAAAATLKASHLLT